MLRNAIVALAGVALVSGCAVRSPLPEAERSPGAVHWVEGPTPEVRTLLLSPIQIGSVEAAGHAPVRLEVGAFFARFQRTAGAVDQLALMLEVTGMEAPALLRASRELLLEIDGELFVGQPGVTENSFRVDREGDASRATVVIPVTAETLQRLAEAKVVRGRLGLWASFTVPSTCRERFRELLLALPADASSTVLPSSRLRRVTEATD